MVGSSESSGLLRGAGLLLSAAVVVLAGPIITEQTGTSNNDPLSFVGEQRPFSATLVNPYDPTISGQIDAPLNVNISSYDGLEGYDTLTYSGDGDVHFVRDDTKSELQIQVLFGVESFLLADGDDVLILADPTIAYGDVDVEGGSGNDVVWGNVGADTIRGNTGDDQLHGGPGNDSVIGNEDNDVVRGGEGDDLVSGDAGDDAVFGDRGNDTVVGGSGSDVCNGGDGNDVIAGNTGDDVCYGGDGNDVLLGDAGVDELFGGAGNDDMRGGADSDTLSGGCGQDKLRGGPGADILNADGGQDTLIFDQYDATIDTVSQFDAGVGGDAISLTQALLTGFVSPGSTLEEFVQLQDDGNGGTLLLVDRDGPLAAGAFVTLAVLHPPLTASVAELIADGNLVFSVSAPEGPGGNAACPGDANGDNAINGADLSVLLSQFGRNDPCGGLAADFNGDLSVDGADLSVMLGRFGLSCP